MPGCGGLRKIRVADPSRGKGKRGGIRVIYLHVTDADVIFLMDIYGKDEQAELTADQKKALKDLAESYKRAAIQAAGFLRRGSHEIAEGSQAILRTVENGPGRRDPPRKRGVYPENHDP